MTETHCHGEGVTDSVDAYLQDATFGINSILGEIRTESSLTSAQLPDIAQFEVDQILVDEFPYCATIATDFRSATGESVGRTNAPGRRFGEVDVEVSIVILGSGLSHDAARSQEATVHRAGMRYAAAMHRLLMARPARGQSLNAGSGRGVAKIVNIFGITQILNAVLEDVNEPNRVIKTLFSVRTSEE